MAILVSVPSQNYPATQPGQPRKVVTPQSLDPAVSRIKLTLTRENWPAGNPLVKMGFDYSPDGGNTWQPNGDVSLVGGVFLDRSGQPTPEATVTVDVPDVGSATRRMRASVENFSTFKTAITIETI